jgi:hypothetical protein
VRDEIEGGCHEEDAIEGCHEGCHKDCCHHGEIGGGEGCDLISKGTATGGGGGGCHAVIGLLKGLP